MPKPIEPLAKVAPLPAGEIERYRTVAEHRLQELERNAMEYADLDRADLDEALDNGLVALSAVAEQLKERESAYLTHVGHE